MHFLALLSSLFTITLAHPQPERIAAISHQVFGSRWSAAACIAHYESTDGAHLVNGVNRGPWQVSISAHLWVNAQRLVTDWTYSARVTYRISNGGRDGSAWRTTSRLCGLTRH